MKKFSFNLYFKEVPPYNAESCRSRAIAKLGSASRDFLVATEHNDGIRLGGNLTSASWTPHPLITQLGEKIVTFPSTSSFRLT